ncbi:TonB-dependent receptor [Sphingobacterium sp. UBA6645]|uniref:TonB-dependent receptor n=1 Tax=Sphingobacterium sp. UBA6645 TaxID=1947511 RepID=UPI0025D9DE0A|nr:carboxypeptidase regulatory-like domain-containing protein [Sphingobacterium sp. UBA6645]
MKKSLLFFALVLASYSAVQAQVTSSSMTGVVKQHSGSMTEGASIKAIHTPSGTVYSSSTNEAGRFSLVGMRVGGPYRIEISHVGQEPIVYNNVFIQLGRAFELNPTFGDDVTIIDAVEITGQGRGQNLKTGASTQLSNRHLQSMPTISRSLKDFTRLTPQADVRGEATSIGGMHNRFNQLTIDGAVSNDVFGLNDAGTNGASTGTSPISLDAIEEINVQVAPFDVRASGFAGGGISAVTRSGTNELKGSAYFYMRNENLTGMTPPDLVRNEEVRKKLESYNERQMGFRLGGPIIKDRLFFFANYERTENVTPLGFLPGTSASNVSLDAVKKVAEIIKGMGYQPGGYLDLESNNYSDKIFTRFDFNLNEQHKLTARYSYVKGSAFQIWRNASTVIFQNAGINRTSDTHSAVVELNSRFSNILSNNLVVGYTNVREPRGFLGEAFPRVAISSRNLNINLGPEPFSTINQLNQNILTLTNNLTLLKGNHTITFGTHNEFYKMYNGFIGNGFGSYVFTDSPVTDINPATNAPYTALENFERKLASNFRYAYSNTDDPRQVADISAMQLGFYIQDDFQVASNFKLTAGLRVDIPIYTSSPLENKDFNNSILAKRYDVQTNRMPNTAFMWSPRVGFNWDVNKDRSAILRGGVGIFASRYPFVWSSGAYTQSGVLLGGVQASVRSNVAPNIPFIPDANKQPKSTEEFKPSGNISVLAKDLKLPQMARASIGMDYQLPWGVQATVDAMFSRNLSNFRFRDLNVKDPIGQLEGADNRLMYEQDVRKRLVLPNYTQVIYIDNVNKGYAWSGTAQLSKHFDKGFFGSVAYTYTESKDLFSGSSSQNQSNFYRTGTINGSNNITLGHNSFSTGSRIVAYASYHKEYLRNLGTTISLVYNGQSGNRFAYMIAGDPGGHSAGRSDQFSLMYIPKNASEIKFVDIPKGKSAAEQSAEFEKYIESNPYLKSRRGQYAERNGDRTPFSHQFDLKLLQDVFVNVGGKKNTIQLSIDIMNIGALVNKNWGKQYQGGQSFWDNSFRPIVFDSFEKDTNIPQYRLGNLNDGKPYFQHDLSSRWSAQVGLRYIFN